MKGLSKSSIIAASMASFLSGDGGDRRVEAMARRLDRLTHQFRQAGARPEHPDRDRGALRALLPLGHAFPCRRVTREAARAQGRARFEQFVQQLARHLQRGNSLVKEVHEEVFPDHDSKFFGDNPAAPTAATEASS